MEEYVINEFHPDLIAPTENTYRNPTQGGSKVVFIGKPGTGKSTLIKYIIYSKRNIIPIGVVMNGTEEETGFYSNIFPPSFVHNEYKEKIIENFINRQKKAKESITNPWGILLLDDCTEDKKIFKSKLQQSIFKNGRHWKMLYFLSLQYSIDLPTSSRTCVDGAFIFKESNYNTLKGLYENYAGIIPTFSLFKSYMDNVTGNYTALYIDSQNQQNKEWHESVYYVKAPIVPDFKFGCKEYRACGKDRIDPKYLITIDDKIKNVEKIMSEKGIIKSIS